MHTGDGKEKTDHRGRWILLSGQAATVTAVALLLVIITLGAWYAVDVLLLAFAGVLLAVLLRAAAGFIGRITPRNDGWSLVVTLVIIAGLAALIGWYIAPRLVEQSLELQESLPRAIENFSERIDEYQWGQWVIHNVSRADEMMARGPGLVSRITGLVSNTFGIVAAIFIIGFVGIYLAAKPEQYRAGIVKLVPPTQRSRAGEILDRVGENLKWWLLGKLISMVIIGVLTWIGLMIIGIDIALTLALIAALLTFVPNFGPIISAIPAVLLGLLDGWATAAWVAALYAGSQVVESYLITPLIQQRMLHLPPALIITFQIVMGVLIGGIGLALATPLLAVIIVLIKELYIHDVLGDEGVDGRR